MKNLLITLSMITLLSFTLIVFAKGPGGERGEGGNGPGSGGGETTFDAAEEVHLLFMRAEEKLAHDVYYTLGLEFPDIAVFNNIMNSESNHVASMVDKVIQYIGVDPNADNYIGEFADENYGVYFTGKYNDLAILESEYPNEKLLEALKNGALIEEMDIHDIVWCPDEIVATVEEITDDTGCGMEYTDEKTLINSFENLLDGSKKHLRAFVRQIEASFPEEYPYQAQYLSQTEVDEILGR